MTHRESLRAAWIVAAICLSLIVTAIAVRQATACGYEWAQWPNQPNGVFEVAGCSVVPNTQYWCPSIVADEELLRTGSFTGGWIIDGSIGPVTGPTRGIEMVGATTWTTYGNSRPISFDPNTEDCGSCHQLNPVSNGVEWSKRENRSPGCESEDVWFLGSTPLGFGSGHSGTGLTCFPMVCGEIAALRVWSDCRFPNGSLNPDPGCTFGYYNFPGVSAPYGVQPDADIDDDLIVGSSDLSLFFAMYGQSCAGCPEDLDGDGAVGSTDYTALSERMGQTLISWVSPLGHTLKRYSQPGPCPPGGCYITGTAVEVHFEPDAGFHE